MYSKLRYYTKKYVILYVGNYSEWNECFEPSTSGMKKVDSAKGHNPTLRLRLTGRSWGYQHPGRCAVTNKTHAVSAD